jgi:putative FmdB family regulatory protein
MPIYDYVCAKCGYEIEVIHSVNGHGPSTCPSCGGPLKKAIVAPAVHFKGSGWARKERTGSGRASRASSESGSGSGSSSGGEPASSAATESSATAESKADKADKANKADRAAKDAD